MWPWVYYQYKYEFSQHVFRYPILLLVIIYTFHDISSTISGRIKTAEVLVEIFYCLYFSKSKDRKIKLRVSKHIWSCEFLFFINTAIKIYCGCLLLGVMILFVSLTHFDIISIVSRSIESDRSQRFFQELVYSNVKYHNQKKHDVIKWSTLSSISFHWYIFLLEVVL